MGKNIHGGNGHKKFARKHSSKSSNKLRIIEDEGELYGIALKMLGNNMFTVHCIDGLTRLCYIRGKFTGRSKRDNNVLMGTWVLIGIREFDIEKKIEKNEMQKCDLLEVYSDYDKETLKDNYEENWFELTNNDATKIKSGKINVENDDVKFVSEKDMERENFIEQMNSSASKILFKIGEEEEVINFDDI